MVSDSAFEVLASGSALLTEVDRDGMSTAYTKVVTLAYKCGNAEDCARVIETMLADPARVEALRFRGHEEVLSKHLDVHRVDQIETWLESWDLDGLVNARFKHRSLGETPTLEFFNMHRRYTRATEEL